MAKANVLEWDTTASNNQDIGGTGILGTNAVNNFDDAFRTLMAQVASGIVTRFTSRSSGYTAVKADYGQASFFTAAATLSLTAAATLTSGWEHWAYANGGDLVVDPNGAETINGVASITIPNGQSALIRCNGTAFYAQIFGAIPGASGFRNKLINGDFDIWQRATTQTTSGYGSDDRWNNENSGSTKTASQQTFTLGQTLVPGNPKFFSRTVVTSSAGTGNYVRKTQRIEGVRTLSGRTVTLTFYGSSDASRNIAVEFVQNFGTGGSPSSAVTSIGSQLVALTTTFAKKSVTIAIPSISGKTLGSGANDYLELVIWYDAGSTFNARAASLGQQSGQFDIAHVSIVEGDATSETDPFSPRHVQQELSLCQRYFEAVSFGGISGYGVAGTVMGCSVDYKVRKRAAGATAVTGWALTNNVNSQTTSFPTVDGFQFNATIVSTGGGFMSGVTMSVDAEL